MSRLKKTLDKNEKSLFNFNGGFSNQVSKQSNKTIITTPDVSIANTTQSSKIDLDDLTIEELPLEIVKAYLRVDHDLDDLEIQLHLQSAISYVRNYISQPDNVALDKGLLAPILALVAYFYENKSVNSKTTERLDSIFSSTLHLYRMEWL